MQLQEIFFEVLNESIQLADKLYFKTNKLSDKDREILMSITNGDNYSKFISDVLLLFKDERYYGNKTVKTIKEIYDQIKSYNKNVFPIFGLENINKIDNISQIVYGLKSREKLKKELKKLPSIGIRNLKYEIRKPRTPEELYIYDNQLSYFTGQLSYLDNKNEDGKKKIYQKLFKNNMTLDQLSDFLDDKENLISGDDVTKESIMKVVKENDYDLSIVYDNKNYMIIKVESPEGIKSIGCNSLWCFTYGSGFDNAYRQWGEYSTNDIVYVIVNFNIEWDDPEFMNVVIKPIDFHNFDQYEIDFHNFDQYEINFDGDDKNDDDDDDDIFNLTNDQQNDSIGFIKNTIGINTAMKILTFEDE